MNPRPRPLIPPRQQGEAGRYDCQECGACCVDSFGTAGYVWLAPGEVSRMERLGLPVVWDRGEEFLGSLAHDGPGGGRVCPALAGMVGGRCGCSIYPDRPAAWQQFEVGGFNCRAARPEAGLPV
jgi:Fe-S-cluster containining protein